MGLGAGAQGRAPWRGPGDLQRAVGGFAWTGPLWGGFQGFFSGMARLGPTVLQPLRGSCAILLLKSLLRIATGVLSPVLTSAFSSEQTPHTLLSA